MTKPRLILIDPGHFHAALVQKEMYEGLSPEAHVYAPLGPELIDYLGRIARFNAQAEMPTAWQLRVEAAPDFLARLAQEPPGGVAVIAGRNGVKIDRIEAAVEAGLHVLADKPAIIRHEDLSRLEAMLSRAAERGLVVHDLMTGRQDEIGRAIRALRNGKDPAVVNFSSTSAAFAHPYMAAYAASKGGVQAMTHALALEFAKDRIRFNSVQPGSISSGMTDGTGESKQSIGPGLPDDADYSLFGKITAVLPVDGGGIFAKPDAVAAVVAMLGSTDAYFVTGTEVRVDGGTHM